MAQNQGKAGKETRGFGFGGLIDLFRQNARDMAAAAAPPARPDIGQPDRRAAAPAPDSAPPPPDDTKAAYFRTLRLGDAEALKKLLDAQPQLISAKDADKTGMHVAAHHNNDQCLLVLFQRGADLNARDKDGWTPLCYAASVGAHQSVWMLAECGADIHAESNNGETPLTKAVKRFRSDLTPPDFSSLKTLVTAGSDPSHKTSGGDSAYSLAKSFGRDDVVMALLQADRQRLDNQDIQNGIAPAIRVMTPATIKKRNRPGHNAAGLH